MRCERPFASEGAASAGPAMAVRVRKGPAAAASVHAESGRRERLESRGAAGRTGKPLPPGESGEGRSAPGPAPALGDVSPTPFCLFLRKISHVIAHVRFS